MTRIADAVQDDQIRGIDPVGTVRRKRSAALSRLQCIARNVRVYARPSAGPLAFWYERPEINEAAFGDRRQYFMRFQGKATYAGPFDDACVPLLDYRGDIGRQYNPIAIAQYGLARFNRWCITSDAGDRAA